jgi:hypothetical protein
VFFRRFLISSTPHFDIHEVFESCLRCADKSVLGGNVILAIMLLYRNMFSSAPVNRLINWSPIAPLLFLLTLILLDNGLLVGYGNSSIRIGPYSVGQTFSYARANLV